MRRWRPLTTVLLAAVVALSAASPARAADQGIQLLSSQQLDPRLTDLTLSTPALRQPTHVRVLLPSGYDAGQDRYPVLYLLHGALADYRSWDDYGPGRIAGRTGSGTCARRCHQF